MAIPTLDRDGTDVRGPASALRTLAAIGEWSLAGAVCAGGAWAVAFALTSLFLVPPTSAFGAAGDSFVWPILWGLVLAGSGFLVGIASGLFINRDNRRVSAAGLSVAAAIAGAVGGALTPLIVGATDGVLHPVVSSSLAWAAAGLLAGVVGYCWSRWIERPQEYSSGSAAWALAGAMCTGWRVGSHQSPEYSPAWVCRCERKCCRSDRVGSRDRRGVWPCDWCRGSHSVWAEQPRESSRHSGNRRRIVRSNRRRFDTGRARRGQQHTSTTREFVTGLGRRGITRGSDPALLVALDYLSGVC